MPTNQKTLKQVCMSLSICFGSQQLSSPESNLTESCRLLTLSREGPSPSTLHGDNCIMLNLTAVNGGGRETEPEIEFHRNVHIGI